MDYFKLVKSSELVLKSPQIYGLVPLIYVKFETKSFPKKKQIILVDLLNLMAIPRFNEID